jgi:NADH-quinone oxidoreductase subunit N
VSATAVHSLWTTAAEPITKIDAPKIEYGQLSPTLIVVGAAHRATTDTNTCA